MFTTLERDLKKTTDTIINQRVRELVINDSIVDDYEERICKIQNAFNSILPEKCGFEK